MAEDRSQQMLNVYKKADGSLVTSGDKGAKSAAIAGLKPNTAVAAGDYQVSYTDGTAESDKVDVPAFKMPDAVQSAPTVAVTAGDAKVDYTITAGKDSGGSTATGYKLSYATDGKTWTDVDVATDALKGSVASLTNGTEYSFKAIAVNGVGNSAESAVVKATPKAATVAVTGVTADPATASVEVGATATATIAIAPDNATDKTATVASADETKATATIADGVVTITGVAATAEDAPVKVTVTASGKTADIQVAVTTPAAE